MILPAFDSVSFLLATHSTADRDSRVVVGSVRLESECSQTKRLGKVLLILAHAEVFYVLITNFLLYPCVTGLF
jgi:hypothetical protein